MNFQSYIFVITGTSAYISSWVMGTFITVTDEPYGENSWWISSIESS